MRWQYTPYTLPLLTAAVLSTGGALYAWRRRGVTGARSFALIMLASTLWSVGNALELAAADLPAKLVWVKLQYLGIVVVPTAWVCLALQYTGRGGWLLPGRVAALATVPLLTLLLVWTDESHSLFWSSVSLDSRGSFARRVAHGRLFWAHTAYSYLLLVIGCGFLVQALFRASQIHRAQARALLTAVVVPWAANIVSLAGLSPLPDLDPTPFAFTLSGLALGWALFRFGILEIVPVAREAVIESMDDGVVVLDAQERLVDLNPAARAILGAQGPGFVGRPAAEALPFWTALDRSREGISEVRLGEDDAARTYEVRGSPLSEPRPRWLGGVHPGGRVIVLRDVTERKRAEDAEHAAREQAERLLAATQALSATMDLQQVLARILSELQQVVPYDSASVQELKGDRLEVIAGHGFPNLEELLGMSIDVASRDHPNGDVIVGRAPVILGDAPRVYASFASGPAAAARIRSWLGVPLLFGDRIIGMLTLDRTEPGFYTFEHARLAAAFATQASAAMENARLFAAAQRELGERQRAQEELQRSEARYRDFVETATDVIYRTDPAGRFTYVNPMVERLFGFSEAELIGRSYLEFIRPDWRERVTAFYAEQYFNLVPTTYFELPIVTKAGRELWLGCSVQLLIEHDAPVAFQAINRDITERKRAEQALKESEERNRAIVETAYDAFVSMDAGGRITAWNPQAETTFGWSRAEAVGRVLADTLIPERLREAHRKGLARFLATGEGVVLNKRLELTGLHKDGREFPVELTISAVRSGDTHLFHAFIRDVSERRRVEQALRESENRFRQLAENIEAVFFMRTLNPVRLIYASPAFERVWGRPRDSFYEGPMGIVDTLHPEDREAYRAALERQSQGYDLEYRILRPDGSTRWIHSRAFPVRDEHGEVRRVAGIAEDVTERKRAEQLRDDLTRTLVHDLRNPLTPALGFLELLQASPAALTARKREMLEFALRGTRRVLRLVDEILDVSRLEKGAMPLERAAVSIAALVSEAVDLQSPLAKEKRLRLESQVGEGLPPAWADPGLVGRVLQNLIGNAVKFTPEGGVVRISARVDTEDPKRIRVGVADTGPGIPPDLRSRLFENFATGRQHERGSGLGLAFCRLAVEAHGGRIWLDSSAQGATFVFTLPVPG